MSAQCTPQTWTPRYATRATRMQASEIRELLRVMEQPGIISFAGGIPDPALFPLEAVRKAYDHILQDPATATRTLQYSISEGDPGLRDWIVKHMAANGIPCDRDNILITNGSQQGLEFLGKLFLSPRDTALVTAPTYLGALQAFSANEPVYDELQLAATNRTASSYEEAAATAGGTTKFAYVVPDFANPTGETLSVESRRSLLNLARDLDVPIIEDSPYSALRFEGEAVPSIQALDIQTCGTIEASRVIQCGSFSKIFMPGLRIGWICAAKPIIRRLTLIKQASDLNSPALNQAVALHLAETLFNDQVEKAKTSYRIKRDAMLAALELNMPKGTTWSRPEGGMFVWLDLPKGVNSTDLLQRAVEKAGVAYVPGKAFFASGGGETTMRLSFSLASPGEIETGIKRLAILVSGGT